MQGLFEYGFSLCYTELVKDNCEVYASEVKRLKDNIHPKFYITTVTCACGESFETGSTRENIRLIFAQSAIRFPPVCRGSSIPAVGLRSSARSIIFSQFCLGGRLQYMGGHPPQEACTVGALPGSGFF